ncbi:restriction endonuclease subunit R [Microbacterium phyllosphaerae]|uniref:restriction endonuclease subunit R n=1 Tax=Microbacterium phyllosphaerae TaxID=124798 RepID=UPI000EA0F7F4|nr:restriction endonuclease subunit R [Microbacterium phyllosphaerae]
MTTALPSDWTLSASAFNWSSEIVRAERTAPDIAIGIVAEGIASVIEVELGQLWRSYPVPTDAEAEALRESLAAVGGRVSIVGASIDDWDLPARRRSDAERLAFLLPQLRAAHRLGASGLRLPIGQAGPALLADLLPHLHELDLVLFEEAQGRQTPSAHTADYDTVAAIDDSRVRLLIDISMLMPALPTTYLERLSSGGIPPELISRLTHDWREAETHDAVMDLLRSGGVPGPVHTLYMDMLVRFGRSDAAELRGILPLVGAFHLKFWDLDDADRRISTPIRALGAELAGRDVRGTFTSEWGGLEWLDDDAAEMTRAHLTLARTALGIGVSSARV